MKSEPASASALAQVAGISVMALGLMVMIGWHLDLRSIVQIHPGFVPMQFNAALSFFLAGLGLVNLRRARGLVAATAGAVAMVIGLLTLIEHIFQIDVGLDQLFMRHYITVGTSTPGRMAPNTALCFTLTGAALNLAVASNSRRRLWQAVSMLAALIVGLGMVALIGYLIGLPTAYGWGGLTRMAAHTAMGFMVLGGGLMALGWQSVVSTHDWRPWAIGLVTTTIAVTLWQALRSSAGSSGAAADLMLVFGVLMALALANAVADAQKLRRAAAQTEAALSRLGEEIRERKRVEEQVRQIAFYDVLTQLPNRRLAQERLGQTIAANKRSGHLGALMFLDLDNFKPLNDTHGHAVGDLLLIEVAQRLKSCVRESDTVARFGGDEFLVIANDLGSDPDTASAQALKVASKILAVLSEPYDLQLPSGAEGASAVEHRCTASIGVALFTGSASQDDVTRHADAAMYQAKDAGRNAIRFSVLGAKV